MTTERRCLILDLVEDDDAIAWYRDRHRPGGPPPAVMRAIRDAGVVEMEIFLSGNRLVMIVDAPVDRDGSTVATNADADNPDVQAWEAAMDTVQRPVGWADPAEKWTPAQSIFRLSDQP